MASRKKVGEAFVEVGADIGPLEKGLKKGKQSTSLAATAMQSAMSKAGVGIGLSMASAAAAVGAFVVRAVQDFAKLDRAYDQNARSLQKLGYSYQEGRKFIEGYADSIERLTEFSDEEAATSFNGLLRITKDVNASMQLNALAMDKVARDGGSLVDVAETLALAYQGNQRGLAQLSRELGIVGPAARSTSAVFAELEKRYKGAAKESTSLSVELAKLSNAFGNLFEKAGEFLAPGVKAASQTLRNIINPSEILAASNEVAALTMRVKKLREFAQASEFGSGQFFIGAEQIKDVSAALKEAETRLTAAKAKLAGLRAAPGGAGPIKPKAAQSEAADEAAKDKARLEVLNQEIDLRNQTVEQMVQYAQAQEAIGETFVGPVANSMQTFFEEAIQGYKSMQEGAEAVAKAIGKAFILMYAQVLEQQAAVAFAEAMGSSLNPFTALLSPGLFAKATLLASAAGGLRAVAANMAEGGMVKSRPGGTVVRLGERGEDEFVVPARKMGGFGGGIKVDKIELVYNGVKDAKEAMSSGRARAAAGEILVILDKANQSRGVRAVRGGAS